MGLGVLGEIFEEIFRMEIGLVSGADEFVETHFTVNAESQH